MQVITAPQDPPEHPPTIWQTPNLIDKIIDEYAFSNDQIPAFDPFIAALYDLLRLALVGRNWVKRSRYHFFREGYKTTFYLDSARKVRVLSDLLDNRHCTLRELTLKHVAIHNIVGRRCDPAIFPFLQKCHITRSFSITLSHPPLPSGAILRDFPWNMISSWTLLKELTVVGKIPRIQTIGAVILALPNLKTLKANIAFEYSEIPPVSQGLSLPSIENLEIGPRGYPLLRWFSLYPQARPKVLSLDVDSEDPSPLEEYAFANSEGVNHLSVTLHQGTYASDLAQGMMFLDEVLEMKVQLLYPDHTATQAILRTLEALSPGIASEDLMDLTITLPTLQDGVKDQLIVLSALEGFLTESVPLLPVDLCICVSERNTQEWEFF
ncbi:hypothetical protein DFP72DRAFT_1079572 [Ephemerocybe angulata]|uniref:Uncharacterized protein n=1 Tax=Ephemerocybe angulata TaxID=980116 RepID=A0A8H6LWG8_9AGAR|nr:hypothetical protein DFP72DRAFT_1079572 [Tulosesus angulatus]